MGFPKIDINDVMSSVEKQKQFYDLVLDYLEQISGKLSSISMALHLNVSDPISEKLDFELERNQLSVFSENDSISEENELFGGNK